MPRKRANENRKELERALVPICDLNLATYNPRTIDEAALKGLGKSVERFGIVQEIVVNKNTMTVISGHQRLKVIKGKYEAVPVVFVNLDETEEKALNIALNSKHLAGEFTDSLQNILAELQSDDENLFNDLRLDGLLEKIKDEESKTLEYKSKFEVVIECDNEEHQQELYERFNEEGLSVKVISV